MTIEAARGKSTRAKRAMREEREDLPIGEADANIFNCPACARPLGVGTSRCPGCSTRLIASIRLSRAVGFMAVGAMVGSLLGGGLVGVAWLVNGIEPVSAVHTTPVVAPSGAPIASAPIASARAPVIDPAIPPSALSALRQSALLNQRLVTDSAKLTAALAARESTSVEIARALRALAANAAFGDRIAPDVADWTDAALVSDGLTDFYATIGATAREGLAASLNNTGAYVAAGRAMLGVMDGLDDLDAAARALAASAQLELAPLTVPGEAGTASTAP
jgi:hypothetical protein